MIVYRETNSVVFIADACHQVLTVSRVLFAHAPLPFRVSCPPGRDSERPLPGGLKTESLPQHYVAFSTHSRLKALLRYKFALAGNLAYEVNMHFRDQKLPTREAPRLLW